MKTTRTSEEVVDQLLHAMQETVRIEAFIKSKMPPQVPSRGLSASGENQRGAVFRVDLQEVRLRINTNGGSKRE
jgi:hypothetical protein